MTLPGYRRLAPLAIGLASLTPALAVVLSTGFDGLYGQDPYGYYDYAMGPLRHSLISGAWPPPPLLWPPGYPFLTVLASFLVGPSPLAGQLVSMACAVSIPVLAWLLVDALFALELSASGLSPRVARAWAAIVAAPTAQLVQSGIVVMADVPALAAASLSAWALVRYRASARQSFLLLASSALAWAVAMRWSNLVLAPVWAAFVLLPGPPGRDVRTRVTGIAIGAATWLAWLAPVVWLQLARGEAPYAGYDWRLSHAFATAIETPDGLLVRTWPNAIFYLLAPAHRYYFTWFVAPFLVAGLVRTVRARAWATLVLTLGWTAAAYVLAAGAAPQNFRFTLAFLTSLAALAGVGFAWAMQALGGWRRVAAMTAGALGVASMLMSGLTLVRRIVEIKQADLQTTRWVDQQTPEGAVLLAFSVTLTVQHYGRRDTRDLYEQSEADLRQLLGAGRPTFLLVEVDTMHHQWRDRSPGRNFRWLQTHASPILVGRHRTFSLFRLQTPSSDRL